MSVSIATEEMAGTRRLVRLSTPDWKPEHPVSDHLGRPIVGVTYVSTDLAQFTHWRNMFNGVVAAGATPVSIDCAAPLADLEAHVARMDGLILSGGGDVDPRLYGGEPDDALLTNVNPLRDQQERVALDSALSAGLPILAICRGLQFVNVAFGGTLYADLARDKVDGMIHQGSEDALDRPKHEVEVSPGSLIAKWMGADGPVQVNSKHHQGIAALAPGLTAVAHSPDGLVEAVEAPQDTLVGIQWHPEVLWPREPNALALLCGFVNECREYAGGKRPLTLA